jgi:hypothetical protein
MITVYIGSDKMFKKYLEISRKEELTEDQVKYIKNETFATFSILYFLFRKQIIPFIGSVILYCLREFLLIIRHPPVSMLMTAIYVLTIIVYIGGFGVYLFYSRRISWNICKWESFEAFKKSEDAWNIAGHVILFIFAFTYIVLSYS